MKIAVLSGKGGTGKSSITSSFSCLAEKALMVDCDVDASNLYLIFNPEILREKEYVSSRHAIIDPDFCVGCGICKDYCHFDAIRYNENNTCTIDEVACEGCGLCTKVCPYEAVKLVDSKPSKIYFGKYRHGSMVYAKLRAGEENSGKLINVLRQEADKISRDLNLDLQILDGPPGIGCPVLSTLTGMDKVVLVTEPTLSGISDLKRVYEVASEYCKKIYLLINKYDLDLSNTQKIKDWAMSLGITVIGEIPFDKEMVYSLLNNQSIIEYDADNICSKKLINAYKLLSFT